MNYIDKYKSFYNSKEWKALSRWKFQDADGLCERCRTKGIVRQGVDVHHIEPISENWERRLDPDNVMLLCKECHNEMHSKVSPLQEFKKYWEDMDK